LEERQIKTFLSRLTEVVFSIARRQQANQQTQQ